MAVVSASLAREFWGAENPVGDTLARLGERLAPVRVVGVAQDVTNRLIEGSPETLYQPWASRSPMAARLVVRTPGDAVDVMRPIRDAVHAIDPTLTVSVWPVRQSLARQLEQARALATLAALVGGLALALALIGIFGVTSFVIGQRMREIGVRIAIGATMRDVVQLLLRDALRPVVIGLALGLLGALAGGQVIAGVLYGVSPRDPVAITAAVAILLGAAALAVLGPA